MFINKINIKLFITLICLAFIGNSIYGNFDDLASQKINLFKILWLSGGILFSFLKKTNKMKIATNSIFL